MKAFLSLAALRVDIVHDWLDYLTSFVALFAAFGTDENLNFDGGVKPVPRYREVRGRFG